MALVSLENYTNKAIKSDSISFAFQGICFYFFEDILPITFQIILVKIIVADVISTRHWLNSTSSLLTNFEKSKIFDIYTLVLNKHIKI